MLTHVQTQLSSLKQYIYNFSLQSISKEQYLQSLCYIPAVLAAMMAVAVLFVPALVPVLTALLCICGAIFFAWLANMAIRLRAKLQQLIASFEGKVVINNLSVRDKVQKDKASAPEGKKILYH